MRTAALLALGLAATPLPAQNSAASDTPSPASNSVVGPRELQDFSLPGTVIKSTEPAVTTPPPRAPRRAEPATTASTNPIITPREPTRSASPVAERRASTVQTAPSPTPAPRPRTPAPNANAPLPSMSEAPGVPTAIAPVPAPAAERSGAWWPWLLAMIAAAGAAGMVYFRRHQAGERLAFAGAEAREAQPVAPRQPAPAPAPRAPAPAPRAAAPAAVPATPPKPAPEPLAGGIVSTVFQPELNFTFTPLSVAVDEAGTAMVVFDLVVHNRGSAPARDVLVEAGMFNAGPEQDSFIATFFANPRAEGDRIPIIAPMGRIGVRSRVSIPGENLLPVELEGRKLLVPLVAFNALYRWSGGETQRSASFLVGRGNNEAPKLAPFALDRGSRAWGDVAARSHSDGLAAA